MYEAAMGINIRTTWFGPGETTFVINQMPFDGPGIISTNRWPRLSNWLCKESV